MTLPLKWSPWGRHANQTNGAKQSMSRFPPKPNVILASVLDPLRTFSPEVGT